MLSRSLVTLALLLVASSNALQSQPDLPKSRKTLNFGYDKPHTRFVTVPHRSGLRNSFIATPPRDPFKVAEDFIVTLLPESDDYSYRIRKDSYTDQSTGVTHVYAKQTYRGLDVADGDVNINVKDGSIISYGNEFYNPRLLPRDQIPLVPPPRPSDDIETLVDPRELLVSFMAMATPSEELANSLEENPLEHLEKIQIASHDWLQEPERDSREAPHSHYFIGVPDTVSDVKGRMVYAQTPSGLELAWKFEIQMEDNWYDAIISAWDSDHFLSVVDWASDSPMPLYLPAELPPLESELQKKKPKKPTPEPKDGAIYQVYQWGTNDPETGNRTRVTESKSADGLASPYGWHTIPTDNLPYGMGEFAPIPVPRDGLVNFSTTLGNNVFAQENWEGLNAFVSNRRPEAGDSLEFVFKYAPKERDTKEGRMKEARNHINATVTQLFYTTNMFHDLMYRYGFDEISGNFQQYNFGRGGRENDAVIANAQDGSGFNNANFMTPPDGSNGRMRMYLWDTATPYRDGDFEAGIVIHELSHGLSTRLTGGPADSSCLAWGEAGGMGEGWGDLIATLVRRRKKYSDFPMGAWAANKANGIRNYVYSLDDDVNPETYKSVDNYFGVHPIGAVWAEILWHVANNLIDKHGFTDDLFPPPPAEDGSFSEGDFYRAPHKPHGAPIPRHGNSLMLQLVVNGMKLQKCRPDFMDARNAIIQADEILTGGENFCDLWKGFASKGLGEDAHVIGKTPWGGGIRTNGFSIPDACDE